MSPDKRAGEVADRALAPAGRERIAWAEAQMPVLSSVGERFASEQPLSGLVAAVCAHITAETAVFLKTLKAAGASVVACASNPLSTQDDVAACLVCDEGIATFARRAESHSEYYAHIDAVLDAGPQLTMDDGCDLVSRLHQDRPELLAGVLGGTEDTRTGVIRLRAMEAAGVLRYPMVAVDDAATKHLFDNRLGTGQSTLDGIMRATNLLLAGKRFVVAGYGAVGRGVAARARGLGALVTVTEIDPLRALEAVMDGFEVAPMAAAARRGEVFVTATGNRQVLRGEHFAEMRDGAVLANAGHFDVEIDLVALARLGQGGRRRVRPMVEEFTLEDGRRLLVLAEGRLVNLSAAEGHPAAVMDLSFANQALTARWLLREHSRLANRVHAVPVEVDQEIARIKLATMAVEIDEPTAAQRDYLASWTSGT